jgi:hypothetical protein
LREVYVPVTEEGLWGNRTNQDLRELYTTPDLVAGIERRSYSGWSMRLEWMKQKWLRKFLKESQKVDKEWEGPELDVWKM